jgi:hypothetical protein
MLPHPRHQPKPIAGPATLSWPNTHNLAGGSVASLGDSAGGVLAEAARASLRPYDGS